MSDFKNRIVGQGEVNPKDIKANPMNWRKHPELQRKAMQDVLENVGWIQDVIVNKTTGRLIDGHLRVETAVKNGETTIPVKYVELTEDEEKTALATFDPISAMAERDEEMLKKLVSSANDFIDTKSFEMEYVPIGQVEEYKDNVVREYGIGSSNNSGENKSNLGHVTYGEPDHTKLSERFVVPPISILDTRQGYWIDRKRTWKNIIRDNGDSRGTTVFGKSINLANTPQVSILDPVLSEIISKWYKPIIDSFKPKCFDVFAGDTIFGYVSSYCGWDFTGIELRQTQCDFNQSRVDERNLSAKYICDDGRNVLNHIEEKSQDLLFSCPPYYDLEVYSDLENDASNQDTYEDFYKILDTAFTNAIKCLKDNRFAVIVCGDVRNKKNGGYYRFPDDIKDTFQRNGFHVYNELILINQVGSASLRASNAMRNRKCVKTHQNVLVFYKGDTSKINSMFGDVDVGDLDEYISSEE